MKLKHLFHTYRPLKYSMLWLCTCSPKGEKQQGKRKEKKNVMRTAEETVKLTYVFLKKKTSMTFTVSPTAFLVAIFWKLIKFTKSTSETTGGLMNPFRQTSQCVNAHFSLIRMHRAGCLVLSTMKQLCENKLYCPGISQFTGINHPQKCSFGYQPSSWMGRPAKIRLSVLFCSLLKLSSTRKIIERKWHKFFVREVVVVVVSSSTTLF